MRKHQLAIAGVVSALLAAAVIAGCGGGGGGYSAVTPPNPSPSPSISPSPSPSPGLTLGNMNVATGGTVVGGFTYAPAANDTVVFTCGCTNQAGITTSNATGNFTVTSPASPTPAVPNPTYTIVPTRNYLVEAQPPASIAGPQAWTILFAGSVASHDLALGDGGAVAASAGTSDVYTTAVALYVYKNSNQNSNSAFDDWNFNTLQTWLQQLIAAPTSQEITLLNDIAAQSQLNKSLFPGKPGWNALQKTNTVINNDLNQVTSVTDPTVPTPCPGGEGTCTGTPTP